LVLNRNLQHEAGNTSTSAQRWKSSAQSWHHINIITKLEKFSTRLTSHQHQHEAENIQQKAGTTSTSTQSSKYSTQGWHHINIMCNRMRQVQQHFVVL
jgi:hypothetical protein